MSPAVQATTRELLSLAWPVVLARIGIMVMGLTDAIVVGNYSAEQLGFHAIAWAPTSVVVTTAVGLMLGVQVMTARFIGEGRREETGAVLRRGVAYALQIGVGSMIGLIVLGPWALSQAGLEDGLAEGAAPALIVFALSMPVYLVSVACQFFLEALSKPKPGMIAMWVANAVNLGLNLVLVPDLLGLGVDGAVASAWSTFGARLALMLFLVWIILKLPEAKGLNIFAKPRPDPAAAREQTRVGLGAGASYFVEVGAFAAMTFIAGRIGGAETAAWAIVLNIAAIVFMAPMGLSSATAVLVGRAYGARDRAGVMRAGLVGLAVVAALTFVVALAIWPTAPWVIGAYSREATLIAIAVPALVLSTLFFVADGIQVVAAQALRAAGDVWWPTAMHVVSYGLVMLPLGWIFALALGLGVNGIVWSVIVASLVSAGLLTGRFLRVARQV